MTSKNAGRRYREFESLSLNQALAPQVRVMAQYDFA